MRFISTKRRRRDQWKLSIRPCLKGPVFYSSRTSQDKTSNAESFDSESVTSCRISGCLSDQGFIKNILGGCIHTETQ